MIPEYGRQAPLVRASEDVERIVRRRAVLTVCRYVPDVGEAAHVLEVLGLDPHEGRKPTVCDGRSVS